MTVHIKNKNRSLSEGGFFCTSCDKHECVSFNEHQQMVPSPLKEKR